MDDLWLHPLSRRQLDALRSDLPQSLLLSGKLGVGLGTIAKRMAGKEIAATIRPENTKGEADDFGSISIEAVRRLYEYTRTKQTARRIVIIDNADRMSRGAQAAFLKILEEPNVATHFILTSHQPNILLPTIRSRLQQVVIQPLPPEQTAEFIAFQGILDEKKKIQLQFIAPGLPAEILRLVGSPSLFEAKAKIIADARTLLQADVYQKLKLINTYRSNRDEALHLVEGAMAILKHSLTAKPQSALITQLDKLLTARECIAANYSIPLTLAQTVL